MNADTAPAKPLTKGRAIAIILPPKEGFGPARAGAVALTVKDLIEYGSMAERCTVFGGEQDDTFEGIRFEGVGLPRLRWRSKTLSYADALVKRLKALDARVVEVHSRVNIFHHLAERLPGVAVCLHLHNDPWSMKGAATPAERRRILERAGAIYCASDYLRQRFLDGLDGDDRATERVQVIYNGLDMERFQAAEMKHRRIVYVGRLIEEKGVRELAHALTEVLPEFPEWRADLIGARRFGNDAPSSAYERAVIETLAPLGERVVYHNALPHAEVVAAYREAEVAAVPSIMLEGFGRTALEAMACGCALINSRNGALPEVCGEATLALDEVSPSAIAAALRRLLGDQALRRELQAKARRRAIDTFDIHGETAKLDAMRERLLS